ncbi:GlxA family transcriptional regulator [Phenylobacterium sp.]|uniref:GlxA family transcriptional regulator n=1 Tax=Phenylobacterium sp. TaxID=1871053 RepID=UPI0025E6667B|nr:helix-turn-helix domain-containing protein [Phenylobacterium sp.]
MPATTVIALEGALASSVTITLDVLAMANRICHERGRQGVFDVRLAGSGAQAFRPFLAFPEAAHDAPDLLVIPAQGFSKSPSYADRLAGPDVAEARRMVLDAATSGADVTSSCTGGLLLASTGLLDGRRATTAWWLAPVFREMFPEVRLDTRELVLTDGPFTTAGAAMAQMDLTVGLVARYAGGDIADACARRMVLDERRSQTPYLALGLLAAADESVSRAAAYARSRLMDPVGVNDLAGAAGLAPRTFSRRVVRATGLSPVQFLQRLRMERAVELIETTTLPFEAVAYQVGYADPSALRGILRRSLGVGPREIRARARPQAPGA